MRMKSRIYSLILILEGNLFRLINSALMTPRIANRLISEFHRNRLLESVVVELNKKIATKIISKL